MSGETTPSHAPLGGTDRRHLNLDAGGNSRPTELGRTAYLQALEDGWADPRRIHHDGRRARALFDGAREAVAQVLGARTEEVWFAPSPTAAFHAVVPALLQGRKRAGNTVVTSKVERSALLNGLSFAGADTRHVAVDQQARIDSEQFAHEVALQGVAFAALQHANHEVATVQPLEAAREATRAAQVPLLVDATSSIGHLPAPRGLWDALVASPADWGGGQGVGVLALKARTRTRRTWPEDQDAWFPGGTSLPAVFAAAVTLQEAERERQQRATRAHALVERIRTAAALIPDVQVLGDPSARLPHMTTFSCLYVDSEALMSQFDRIGIAVGSGSACTSATLEPSHVLAAMGVLTHGNVRVALDWDVTEADVDRFLAALPQVIAEVRGSLGVDGL